MDATSSAAGRGGSASGGSASRRSLVFGALLMLLLAPMARGYVPPSDRTLAAVAAQNRASGRSQAIRLALTMRVGDRPPVARGELVSHPSGLARLELIGASGRTERYLLSGRDLAATRNGVPIERPRPLLQPFFLLQPESEETLRSALETFGVITGAIGLAPCGDDDCFVIGDPRLAPPRPRASAAQDEASGLDDALDDPLDEREIQRDDSRFREQAGGGPDAYGERDPREPYDELEGPTIGIPDASILSEDGAAAGAEDGAPGWRGDREVRDGWDRRGRLARLWVDTRGLEVRRFDQGDGSFWIVGPTVSFGRLRVPAWFELHEPEADPIRFDVDEAVQVNAPPQAFGRRWLLAPTGNREAAAPADTGGPPDRSMDAIDRP